MIIINKLSFAVLIGLVSFSSSLQANDTIDWKSVTENTVGSVGQAYQKLLAETKNMSLPPELEAWVKQFTAAPLASAHPRAELSKIGQQLQNNYSIQDLPADQQAAISELTQIIQTMGLDLVRAMNASSGPVRPNLEPVYRLQALHDADPRWVKEKTDQLQAKLFSLDVQGAIATLEQMAAEYKAGH